MLKIYDVLDILKWQCEEYRIHKHTHTHIYMPYVLLFHEFNVSHMVNFHCHYFCGSPVSGTVTPK